MDFYQLIESADVRNWARKSCALVPDDMESIILGTTTIDLEEKRTLLLELQKNLSNKQWVEENKNCNLRYQFWRKDKEAFRRRFSDKCWKKELEESICTLDKVILPIYGHDDKDLFYAELVYLGHDSYLDPGIFDTFSAAKAYLMNQLTKIEQHDGGNEKKKYYGEITLWKNEKQGHRSMAQSYIMDTDGKVIFCNDIPGGNRLDIETYFLRTPFKTGDIIEIDATPFCKPVLGIVFNDPDENENVWDRFYQWVIFENRSKWSSDKYLFNISDLGSTTICFDLNTKFEFPAIRMAHLYKGEIKNDWILRLSHLVKKDGFFDFMFQVTVKEKMRKSLGISYNIESERNRLAELLEKKFRQSKY